MISDRIPDPDNDVVAFVWRGDGGMPEVGEPAVIRLAIWGSDHRVYGYLTDRKGGTYYVTTPGGTIFHAGTCWVHRATEEDMLRLREFERLAELQRLAKKQPPTKPFV